MFNVLSKYAQIDHVFHEMSTQLSYLQEGGWFHFQDLPGHLNIIPAAEA